MRANRCVGNAHEGIDNGGTNTVIEDNVALRNGGVLGPDIAGAGRDVTGDDVPDGTVSSYGGNETTPPGGGHEGGGPDTPQRLDLGESTT